MSNKTDPINILLFLCQGFEDLEAVAILDVFAWTGYREGLNTATVTTAGFHDNIGRLEAGGARVVDQPVVMDNRIISCSGPGASLDVAFLLMDSLPGPETTQQVKHFMMYRQQKEDYHV